MRKFPVQQGEMGGEGGAAGDAAADAPWHTALKNPEAQAFAQQRGWKDSDQVVESYRNLEKLMGAPKDRLLVLPDKEDAPEWGAIHQRLGRPEAADKYNFELKGAYDESFLNGFKQTAFEANLPTAAAGKLATWWEGYVDNIVQQQEQETAARMDAERQQLRSEWGSKHDETLAATEEAARRLQVGKEDFEALEATWGPVKARKFFSMLSAKVLEPSPPGGDGGERGWGTTPEAARLQLRQLEGDRDFMAKYASGDKNALEKYSRLNAAAYPEG